jgi:hypothetical protein
LRKLTANSTPEILKSNTISHFKIISGLQNNLQKHRQLPVSRNKQFEEGLLEGFSQLVSVFIEASKNFIFYFLHNNPAKNLQNYLRI